MISVEQSVFEYAARNPEKVALKSGKAVVSYGDMVERIVSAKKFFESLPNYAVGQKVILAAGKQIGFVYAYFGAHLAGLTALPIDSETNPTRFDFIVNASNPFAVVGFDKIQGNWNSVSLKDFDAIEGCSFDSVRYPDMNSIADILFTTGTTGTPKGVPLTFANEAAAARNINAFIKNSEDDVELLALPISHSFGLGRVRCCLSNGQTLILLGSFVNVKRIYKSFEEDGATGFTMVPSSWKFLQKMSGNQLENYASQIKYIEMGSAYFSETDKRELAALLPNTRVTMHYGLTEASRSAFMEFHEDDAVLNSVGKASPFTDIQVFDENGTKLSVGDEGEICIKGEHVTKGYLNQSNEQSFFGEYFRTGDWGTLDANGYVFLKSRKKELINVGGKKVSPIEVEDQLALVPGIAESACIATSDPNGVLGEVVKACLVRDESVEEPSFENITSMLMGKLEGYKIPVVFEWIDEIPKTANGKIQRGLLK